MNPGRIKCPTCKRDLDWEQARFRPFCSERCRLIDLGAWVSGQRAIPGDSAVPQDETGGDEHSSKRDM
ncbi:MAG TPA: DNA gyrase inhibitor YacG [Steroidobacteraceae bacterium]|jgi:hypothetical protein